MAVKLRWLFVYRKPIARQVVYKNASADDAERKMPPKSRKK
ncbi:MULTISPECIES: hypothetical protein [unclassified Neglectibacter]|nr:MULTISPECIES: hypothetical protein [unclassified Neglectibacter]